MAHAKAGAVAQTHIPDTPCTLEAIHERHLNVHEYEIDVRTIQIRHQFQSIGTVIRDQHLGNAKFQQNLPRQLLVVSGDRDICECN